MAIPAARILLAWRGPKMHLAWLCVTTPRLCLLLLTMYSTTSIQTKTCLLAFQSMLVIAGNISLGITWPIPRSDGSCRVCPCHVYIFRSDCSSEVSHWVVAG